MPDWIKSKGEELAGLVMEDETTFMTLNDNVPVDTVLEDIGNHRQKDGFNNPHT